MTGGSWRSLPDRCSAPAREVGAFYRSALAHELAQRGYAIDAGTGNHGRYFEIAGVPRGLLEAFSARSREVARAAERFRARYGRAPERGELRRLKLENRKAKIPAHACDLQEAGIRREHASASPASTQRRCWPRHVAREQSVRLRITSRSVSPNAPRHSSPASSGRCCSSRRSVSSHHAGDCALASDDRRTPRAAPGGRAMTTRAVRDHEQAIERASRSSPSRLTGRWGRRARGSQRTGSERIGAPPQRRANTRAGVITGPERAAVLIGPAGTGKGVVIDAAARAEQLAGRETLGVAVSGSTAQRLGQRQSRAAGQTFTLDALVARVEHGRVESEKTRRSTSTRRGWPTRPGSSG